jgi:RND family efflux transporter MFP subunit
MIKKVVIIIIILLIVGSVAIVLLGQSRASDKQYENGVVALGDVYKTINVDAIIKPDVHVDISTELPALINWVGVEVNDSVKKGQEILRLDQDSIDAQIKNAQLAVERAELAEQRGRLKSSDLSSKEILSLKKASEQARQTLGEVYAQAKKTSIISTIDGVVTKQNAHVGEVASGILVQIIDPKSLRVEALIPEVDISRIHLGGTARIIFDAYSEKEIMGRVELIEVGSINLQNSTYYRAILAMDNINDVMIFDGMNAEVDIEFERKDNVLVISRAFTAKDENGYFVYTLNSSGENKEIPVKQYFETGLIGDENIEIVEGLSEGQQIVQFITKDKS